METLAGRLKWERTANGIRVQIPAWRNPAAIINGFIFAVWGLAGVWATLFEWRISPSSLVLTLIMMAVSGASLSLLAWNFAGFTDLILDPAAMRIVRRIRGFNWSSRDYSTPTIRNLRYIPPTAFRLFRHSAPGQFRFEVDGKTRSFATGLRDIEAIPLLDRMLEIHKFQIDRAAEYIGIRR